MRRVLPGLLALAAFYADGRGSHGLAFDALLGAIPFAAVSALETFGTFLDARDDAVAGVQALLWALALGAARPLVRRTVARDRRPGRCRRSAPPRSPLPSSSSP